MSEAGAESGSNEGGRKKRRRDSPVSVEGGEKGVQRQSGERGVKRQSKRIRVIDVTGTEVRNHEILETELCLGTQSCRRSSLRKQTGSGLRGAWQGTVLDGGGGIDGRADPGMEEEKDSWNEDCSVRGSEEEDSGEVGSEVEGLEEAVDERRERRDLTHQEMEQILERNDPSHCSLNAEQKEEALNQRWAPRQEEVGLEGTCPKAHLVFHHSLVMLAILYREAQRPAL